MTVTLSASQPVGGTIPGKATDVSMVRVDVRNPHASPVVVDAMVIRRTGGGTSSDFNYVYLYEGANRLTTGRTINSSTNEATFGGLNLSLAAGETKTLTVSADMTAGTAGNQNGIQVVSVTSGSVVASGTPVSGPLFTLAGSSVGSATIATNGSTLSNVDAGQNGAKVGQFQISASGSEDIVLNKVALYYAGTTARENISNLTLKQAGTTIATSSGVSANNLVSFVTTPMTIARGNYRVFEVYANIAGVAKAGETVVFYLSNDSDLYAVGTTYGYGVSVVRTSYDNSLATDASTVTINASTTNASTITASAASTPVAQTYIKGSQSVALGGLILKAGDAGSIKVSSITLTPKIGSVAVGTYDDSISTASLWNGSTQLGYMKSPNSTTGVLTFDNLNLTVPAGQSITITLKGNLSPLATAGTYRYELNANGDISATDVDGSSKTATGAPATFNLMTVADAGTISVTKAADDTDTVAGLVVAGSSNVVLAKYKFNASQEELKLTKVRMQTATPTAVSSLSLYNGSVLVGGPISVDGSGNADFTGLNFVIPKDASVTLTVKGNLNSVGASGATSKSDIKITLRDDIGTFEVRGTSAGSSTQILTTGVGNVVGNSKIIVKSKPTVSLVSLPSSILSDGNRTVARFTISADAAGDVAVKEINFNLTLSNANAVGLSVAVASGSSVRKVGGDYIAGTYNAGVVEFSAEEVIAAGTSMTYELLLTVTGSETDDAISTQLKDISWSDMSNSVGTLIDGRLVKGIPSDTWTISR